MSVRGSSTRKGGSSLQSTGKSPAPSKAPVSTPVSNSPVTGSMIPHPSYPGTQVPAPSSSKFTVLGQIPKPYSSVLASQPSEFDPFSTPGQPSNQTPPLPKRSDYQLNYRVNLFPIEPHMKAKNPVTLATQHFPPGWHFIPFAPYKSIAYYKDILISTDSIHIKPIYDKDDPKKIVFHSLYIKQILSEHDWQNHPSALRVLLKDHESSVTNCFCYYDYIEAWNKIFLHQNKSMSHSWFIQFDHKFKSQIPFWFTTWWSRFGPGSFIFPEPLLDQVTYFSYKSSYMKKPIQHPLIPLLLHFMSKYKIPWILKWQYNIHTPVIQTSSQSASHHEVRISNYEDIPLVCREFYVKWWDKFNIQRIISQVQTEFPPVDLTIPSTSKNPKGKSVVSKSSSSLHLSDLKSYSVSELNTLARAIKERHSELSKTSEDEEDSSSSSSASQASVKSTNPYTSFQDAQDPFA